jgi:hypothetical protein
MRRLISTPRFDTIISILLRCVLINYLIILLFGLCLCHTRPVYCTLLLVFVCCAVSVTGHMIVDSAGSIIELNCTALSVFT